jgi:hypothetical protein
MLSIAPPWFVAHAEAYAQLAIAAKPPQNAAACKHSVNQQQQQQHQLK